MSAEKSKRAEVEAGYWLPRSVHIELTMVEAGALMIILHGITMRGVIGQGRVELPPRERVVKGKA
jgi:hypothetical protein